MARTLASYGQEIYVLIDKITNKDFGLKPDSDDTQSLELILHECDRFKVWAVSLGLLVPGHGSLDYRMRDAENLHNCFKAFLIDLKENLEDVVQNDQAEESHLPYQTLSSLNASNTAMIGSDSDNEEELPSLLILYNSIQDITNRLFRLSTKLRSPATRLRTSKAARFRSLENGIDLFDAYEFFDFDFVRAMFQQHRCGSLPVDPSDSPRDPHTLPLFSENYLVKRIARANTLRRRQFAYWRHHQLKLEQHTEFAVQASRQQQNALQTGVNEQHAGTASVIQPISISTATQLLPDFIDYQDTGSMVSVSEYTPNTTNAADEVQFPSPPQLNESQKFFECPYCFTTCARPTSKPSAWKAHIIHDLSPYICTYELCKIPDQLYDTRLDWLQHEHLHHELSNIPFQPLQQASKGLDSSLRHEKQISFPADYANQHSNNEIHGGQRPARSCPVCNAQGLPLREMQDHLATHLERLALFAIPRSTVVDLDSVDAASSHGNIEDGDSQQVVGSRSYNFSEKIIAFDSETGSTIEESRESSSLMPIDVPYNELRVCIAEDNAISQKLVETILKKFGISTEAYQDGKQVYEALQKRSREGKPFHVVLMNISMPVLDGIQTTRAIRTDLDPNVRGVVIIAITASGSQDSDDARYLEAGMNDCLAKPIRQRPLREMLDKYISNTTRDISPRISTIASPHVVGLPPAERLKEYRGRRSTLSRSNSDTNSAVLGWDTKSQDESNLDEHKRHTRRGKTQMSKRLVSREVLNELGYEFYEEGEELITVMRRLGPDDIDEILRRSRERKEKPSSLTKGTEPPEPSHSLETEPTRTDIDSWASEATGQRRSEMNQDQDKATNSAREPLNEELVMSADSTRYDMLNVWTSQQVLSPPLNLEATALAVTADFFQEEFISVPRLKLEPILADEVNSFICVHRDISYMRKKIYARETIEKYTLRILCRTRTNLDEAAALIEKVAKENRIIGLRRQKDLLAKLADLCEHEQEESALQNSVR